MIRTLYLTSRVRGEEARDRTVEIGPLLYLASGRHDRMLTTCPTLPYFPTLNKNGDCLGEGKPKVNAFLAEGKRVKLSVKKGSKVGKRKKGKSRRKCW